ncbi:MAG: phospho-N-acetylmuramoyl-pentapeptide-transferase [Verrucomicrobiales bacterium]|nr:phospho-N-acetylmuramoyl-pentapeptide-transferase [Verrucomicrobiales bacterium]
MMLYFSQWLLEYSRGTPWEDPLSFLRLFRYLTVRSAGAAITALAISWWLGPPLIRALKRLRFGQDYVDKAQEAGGLTARIDKRGTPTMGGVLIVVAMDVAALLWAQPNVLVLLTLLSVLVLAGLGFYDDYAKITQQSNRGAKAAVKLIVQFGLAGFIALYLYRNPATRPLVEEVMVPFMKHPVATGILGATLGIGLTMLAIVASSNAVNLTDGLDGLAIGCTLIVGMVFLILTYVAGNFRFAGYLQVPYVEGAGELTVVCAAMMGAGLGFLWFNCHPAQVFMGDTGSLALGGALGIMAVLIHQPFVLVIAGAIFVAEGASVLLQTGWFKFTRMRYGEGRRLFRMAPLHHHFEKLGWHETKVVMRFYILCFLFAVLALATLKLR